LHQRFINPAGLSKPKLELCSKNSSPRHLASLWGGKNHLQDQSFPHRSISSLLHFPDIFQLLNRSIDTVASLHGKVIAITGAASGIGLASAHLLASRGASLALADIRQEPLDTAVVEISTSNLSIKIYARAVDVVKSEQVASLLDEAVKQLGKLNGTVNLAGILKLGSTMQDTKDENGDAIIDINQQGVFNCLRAELQRIQDGGSIVTAASVARLKGAATGAAYCASKVSQSIALWL